MKFADYRVGGTGFTYREWAESLISTSLFDIWKRLKLPGTYDEPEQKYIRESIEGFEAGYIVRSEAMELFFIVSYVRKPGETSLKTYLMTDRLQHKAGVPISEVMDLLVLVNSAKAVETPQ